MSQLDNPDTPLDASAPQDEAWTCLLHLETQVQLTQASLIHHTTELSTLRQTTDHISQSLQALLERLLPRTTTSGGRAISGSPGSSSSSFGGAGRPLGAVTTPGTPGHIAWMLSYMKAGWASTYALRVLQHPGGVGSFTDWAAFEKNFQAEFFSIDPAKSATLALRNREQYGQGK
ncbi:hypothetical protein C0993_012475 [Termitomyces sp. T159_Od127]|nr:hypothetical protein C0993_012475 [Termitomyces sp. T159_Od127]